MIETFITVRMDKPADIDRLAKRTGYTAEQVETYLWCAKFANARLMHLPIKRDLNLSKLSRR